LDRKDGHGCCQGGWVDVEIPDHIVMALQDIAPKLDATLYMLLLSSLKLLLAARSCKDDIVVSQLCLLTTELGKVWKCANAISGMSAVV
jgi:hypothetical protein